MPAADLDLLLSLAPRAGDIALRYFQKRPKSWEKDGDQGPVSEADLAIDTFLKENLTAARPGYGWLSEETEDDTARLAAKRVFIVDPIDGTRSFLAGHENFAIAMAVAEQGDVTAAVVHMPAKRITYAAAIGKGATKNGHAIAPTTRSEIKNARVLAAGAQMNSDRWHKGPPPMERHFRSSLAYRLCLVAEGRFDGMLTLRPSWEWDCSAGALICEEAGAVVTDAENQRHKFNSASSQMDGIIAAGPKLHSAVMAYL
ncbi:MAG: 3'(2'),5'-bisphosphate nucleotidase CysQ [Pseudomonadota bacterium]